MPTKQEQETTQYYAVRVNQRAFSKYAVALRAVALLEEGDSILIDAGTSLTPIARILRKLADLNANQTHYTIMTHNNDAFLALSDTPASARFNVFQTGGRYDRDLNASFGHQAEMAYLRFHPRWVFIGHNGLEADLGLFCHGNTEELALKREVFAMPAGGRVIISDLTKIGRPGGLLFGDSSSLTTNVDECWIITDDIHDAKFTRDLLSRRTGVRDRERFETQVRSLQKTYDARVWKTHYVVLQIPSGDYTEKKKLDDSPDWGKFVKEPEAKLQGMLDQQGHDGQKHVFRIHLTPDDVTKPEEFKSNTSRGFVDVAMGAQEGSLAASVEHVELYWDARGRATRLRDNDASEVAV
jgi:DeoR family fructose operon transcriptional repressor